MVRDFIGGMRSVRIALCQVNPTVGDLKGNADLIISAIQEAASQGAEIAVFPELVIPGYGAADLFLSKQFIKDEGAQLKRIIRASRKSPWMYTLVGCLDEMKLNSNEGSGHIGKWKPGEDVANKELYNAAALIRDGRIRSIAHKAHLPTYGVFDEFRWFREGNSVTVPLLKLAKGSVKTGISVCADIWWDDVIAAQARQGAELLVNISASPYHSRKTVVREQLLSRLAKKHGLPMVYVNLIGCQDGIVFYGRSYVISPAGRILAEAAPFKEDLLIVDVPLARDKARSNVGRAPLRRITETTRIAEMRNALVLGIRDYATKNNFSSAVFGLSGGVDSALCAVLASEALGAKNVTGIFMPSRFTSELSRKYAIEVAANLGITFKEMSIEQLFTQSLKEFGKHLKAIETGKTPENIQARLRCVLLMAHSNKTGSLVLATGNKSELATGYCTVYGDLAGGLAVLADVYKTEVYALAKHLNSEWRKKGKKAPLPQSVLTRAPSAELRHNQTDQDTLPPYTLLDRILRLHIEERKGAKELVKRGFKEGTVRTVLEMVGKGEFKRKQMPLGIRVNPTPFGSGRIYPVTNRYSGYTS